MQSNRRAIPLICMVITLFGCSLGAGGVPDMPDGTASPAPPPRADDVMVLPRQVRPNILVILTDDLDLKLGTLDYMPHLQELMTAQGLTIEDFLISTPVCCPARSSILRGQYTHNHQVYTNAAPLGGFEKAYALQIESSTLATWLQAAGYRTALFGKYLNGYPFRDNRSYIPPGWREWYSPARGSPYKEFNYYLNENGTLVGFGLGQKDYLTDVLSQSVDDFLRRSASIPAPFFIYLSTYAPHEPAVPAPRHAGLFPDLKAPRTPAFNEEDVADKPERIRNDPMLDHTAIENLDELYRQRVRSMQAVDEMIARLLATLDEIGQIDNTFIIFTSDNGYHLGQHRMMTGKGTAYEEDIRVPFIIRGPGIASDQSLRGYLTGNIDIAPTIADLAGIIPPGYVDGRSLVPLWAADLPAQADWRQGYLIEYYGSEAETTSFDIQISTSGLADQLDEPLDPAALSQSSPDAAFLAVRTSRYVYVEHGSGEIEFYDLDQDPFELNNLVPSADPLLLSRFSAWLKELASCSGQSCRGAEQTGLRNR